MPRGGFRGYLPNPPKPPEERKRNKMMRLSPVTLAQIETAAKALGMTQTAVVEEAVAAFCKANKVSVLTNA